MSELFLGILNRSLTASVAVVAILLLRLLLRKAPKWTVCALWGIVALRLLLPFSVSSAWSLIPSAEVIPTEALQQTIPTVTTGIHLVNSVVNPVFSEVLAPVPGESVTPLQSLTGIAWRVWLIGVACMLAYALVGYVRLRLRLKTSIPLQENVYQSDRIETPFVFGFLRPHIYLPTNLPDRAAKSVLAHERAHLSRGDHLTKPLAFLLLCVYWFQPFVWVAYFLLCRDLELACDEKAVKALSPTQRADYSEALLACSRPHDRRFSGLAAFGQVGIGKRVKHVLQYKKCAVWVVVVAVLALGIAAACFLTDPILPEGPSDPGSTVSPLPEGSTSSGISASGESGVRLRERYPEYFTLSASDGFTVYVWQMSAGSYSFGLTEGTETNKTDEELLQLRGTSALEMRAILRSYGLSAKKVRLRYWQNPISNYIAPQEPTLEELLEGILGSTSDVGGYLYDSICHDIDGDGILERCVLGIGPTSGVFTFTLEVTVDGEDGSTPKYRGIYMSEWMDLSFVIKDGTLFVQGITQWDDPIVRLAAVSVEDGRINLLDESGKLGNLRPWGWAP